MSGSFLFTRLPVTLAFVFALDETGDIFAAAERLSVLEEEPALHPLRVLMVDMLAPLFALGAIEQDDTGQRTINRERLLRLGLGGCGLNEADFFHHTTLEGLQARVEARAGLLPSVASAGPDAAFLAMMQGIFPDKAK